MKNWDAETRWIVWSINSMILTIFMVCAGVTVKESVERGMYIFVSLFCLGLNSWWVWL